MNFCKAKFRLMAVALVIMLTFTACGEEPPSPPENYVHGEEYFPTIDSMIVDQEITYTQEIEEVAEEEAAEEETAEEDDETQEGEADAEQAEDGEAAAVEPTIIHVYSGIEGLPDILAEYTETMTTQRECAIVDDIGLVLDTPDFTQPGSMILAREIEEPKALVGLEVSWEEDVCRVKVVYLEGMVFIVQTTTITVEEAADFMWTQTTEKLGLEHDSWADYNIYPADGIVQVDDKICYRLDVFDKVNNNPAGTYFLSNSGDFLYRLHDDGTVSQLIPTPGA